VPTNERDTPKAPIAGHLVLVVDDDEAIGELIAMALVQTGIWVSVAHSGRDALERARQHRPDLVVLDLSLPDATGEAIANSLRRRCGPMPIVLVSAQDRPSVARAADAVHAERFFTKPFDVDALENAVSQVLATCS